MIPPLSTRTLQATLAAARRDDAAARWIEAFHPDRFDGGVRRDVPKARPIRR